MRLMAPMAIPAVAEERGKEEDEDVEEEWDRVGVDMEEGTGDGPPGTEEEEKGRVMETMDGEIGSLYLHLYLLFLPLYPCHMEVDMDNKDGKKGMDMNMEVDMDTKNG
eukprot:s719_g2.t1